VELEAQPSADAAIKAAQKGAMNVEGFACFRIDLPPPQSAWTRLNRIDTDGLAESPPCRYSTASRDCRIAFWSSDMLGTLALLTLLTVGAFAIVAIWLGARRVSGGSLLKDVTVSREWLMQHQADDRS
jgi:hypothetical protein